MLLFSVFFSRTEEKLNSREMKQEEDLKTGTNLECERLRKEREEHSEKKRNVQRCLVNLGSEEGSRVLVVSLIVPFRVTQTFHLLCVMREN